MHVFEDYKSKGAKIRGHMQWMVDGDAPSKFLFQECKHKSENPSGTLIEDDLVI